MEGRAQQGKNSKYIIYVDVCKPEKYIRWQREIPQVDIKTKKWLGSKGVGELEGKSVEPIFVKSV